MASADFLKKLGLKQHVPQATQHTAPPATPAQPAPAQVPVPTAKPSGLAFRLGGKPNPSAAGTQRVGTPAQTAPAVVQDDGASIPDEGDGDTVGLESAGEATAVDTPTQVNLNVATTADSFKALLDQFDAMVGQVASISQLELANSRNYVARIMKDLVTHPEYDGFVIARDVHNVMKFVQASSNMANTNFVTSQERKQKAAVKKATAESISLEAFDFGSDTSAQMAAIKAKKAIPASKPLAITDLASMNMDSIETKLKR